MLTAILILFNCFMGFIYKAMFYCKSNCFLAALNRVRWNWSRLSTYGNKRLTLCDGSRIRGIRNQQIFFQNSTMDMNNHDLLNKLWTLARLFSIQSLFECYHPTFSKIKHSKQVNKVQLKS